MEAALDRAMADCTVDGRQRILREWRDWNAKRGWRNDVRAYLGDGFGVDLLFNSSEEARTFMNRVYDRIIESVRAELGRDWKP